MPVTLGYWDLRGITLPIRLLLEYTGTKYEEKFYTLGEAPDYDRSSWLNEKFKLGMDFPNLPYLVDGNRKITQSNAILRYIARKHNLCAETEDEKIRVDTIENQVTDFKRNFIMMCYGDFDNLKSGYLETLPGLLEQFSKFLGDRKWFAGDKVGELLQWVVSQYIPLVHMENAYVTENPVHIFTVALHLITFVDFLMYDVLDIHRMFEPTCLDKFKNLKDLLNRFEALEKIDTYMKSDRFIKTPVFAAMAKWGNKKE